MDSTIEKNKKIFFSFDIYSEEALNLAAYIFEDKIKFSSSKKDNGAEFVFDNYSENDIRDFVNEALNQQCRIDLAAVTGPLTRFIVTKALISGMGEGKNE